jgi:histidyl-tRNA synthetase
MPDVPFPRGMRDLMPNEALFRNVALKKIEGVFQTFGFLTIDTPTLESLDVLKAKNAIGEDTKLIYEFKDENLGLRYDHTVSLARYFGMHRDLQLPFKRYYIGKAWRREEPQKLRYREFTQADIDIIGGSRDFVEAELIAAASKALDSIGIEHIIRFSNRKLIDAALQKLGVPQEKVLGVFRIIDKLDKVGADGVSQRLGDSGVNNEVVAKVLSFITSGGENEDRIEYAENLLGKHESIGEIRSFLAAMEPYQIKGELRIDFSLVRGLDYYTGTVFEFASAENEKGPSIGSGGRYDNLIGLYGGKTVPAAGASIGVDRVLDLLGFSASPQSSYAKVFIAEINDQSHNYAVKVAKALREKAIETDLNVASRNLSNQLAYANALKFKYAIVVGPAEEKLGKVKLKNLVSGEEKLVMIDEAIKTIGTE